MSLAVDVIVDRDDDVATVRAIHRLAAEQSTVLAVAVAPDWRTAPAVIWAILRALGKTITRLAAATPTWADAERWLIAHGIKELVVLGARHLTSPITRDLIDSTRRAELRLTLVHSGERHTPIGPESIRITLAELLARPRTTRARPRPPRTWPSIPRSAALRLRFDCLHALAPQDFQRVDALLNATFTSADTWLSAHRAATRRELAQVVSLLTTASDPDQLHIRRCAVKAALLIHSTPMPSCRPQPHIARPPSSGAIDELLACTDAVAAAHRLAALTTGLQPDLLALIAGDQITSDTIAGHRIPPRTEPVLRALGHRNGPIFDRVPTRLQHAAVPNDPPRQPTASPHRGDTEDIVAAVLGRLLIGRAHRVKTAEVPSAVHDRLADLAADGILDREHGGYRASHIALYSSFQGPARSPAALTTKRDTPLTTARNRADI